MMIAEVRPQAVGRYFPLAIIGLLCAGLVALSWGDLAVGFDQQLYSFIGSRMLDGELPYVDHWDRKPFGLFAIFALAHAIFGSGPEAFQIAGGIAMFVIGAITFAIGRQLVDATTALLATILALLLILLFAGSFAQSETFYLPVLLVMVWLLRDAQAPSFDRKAMLAMLLGGIALQIKYTVLPQCIALGAYVLFRHLRNGLPPAAIFRKAAIYAALGILPTVLVGIYFAAVGAFEPWYFANFVSFFGREPGGRLNPPALIAFLPLLAISIGGIYAAWRVHKPADTELYALVAVWTLACFVSIFFPGSVYRYYVSLAAPAACLAATPLLSVKGPLKAAPILILLAGAVHLLHPVDRFHAMRDRTQAMERLTSAIAGRVDDSTRCLLVFDGPTALYQTTGSCTPSRFVYPDHLNNALERTAMGVDQTALVTSLLRRRPPVIVTADRAVTPQNEDARGAVMEAIEADYALLRTETITGREISVWALRETED